MKILFLMLCTYALHASSPEHRIILVEEFISADVAEQLIQYYDGEKQNLTSQSDNELSFSAIRNPHIQKIIRDISEQVKALISDKVCHLDHAGLYARIAPNYCPYHADNVYFECPVHGKDQGVLRALCPGTCQGAHFVPNHTWWREYTALIYLNEDFEGGEIAFEDGPCNKLYRKIIPIRAHMLVLAPNGADFYHEVFPIRKGKRYSLHLWLTSDANYRHMR